MFDSIETPKDLYLHKLGATLTMENTIVEMLGELEEAAQSEQLKSELREHAEQTRGHVRNVEQVFRALGAEPDEQSCPAIEGLQKEGKQTIKKADERIVDAVVLAAAAETEHHEIAVYETLIAHAEAMDEQDVVALLTENLEQEQQTLRKVQESTDRVAREAVRAGA